MTQNNVNGGNVVENAFGTPVKDRVATLGFLNKRNNITQTFTLKPGESLDNRYGEPAWLVPNRVALLYGPSVDQVFRHVSADDAPQIGRMVNDEFLRQLGRFSLT